MTDSDLEFHAWPYRKQGGQQFTKQYAGVLVVHKETGIAVVVESERSQMGNKALAVARVRELVAATDVQSDAWVSTEQAKNPTLSNFFPSHDVSIHRKTRKSHILDASERALPPCTTCGARQGDPCRSPSWRTREPHTGRVRPRT